MNLDRRQACPGDRLFSLYLWRAGLQAGAYVGCPGLLNLNAVLPGERRRPLALRPERDGWLGQAS